MKAWYPKKTESVSMWCRNCKKYVTRSRLTGKCPFCGSGITKEAVLDLSGG